MHLRSVTLRGFKSFAERTELEFEPGVTVIVGPNGSGKSNVVDALAWVLGTASPKSLRSGQMADVIFAGAPGRPGLGRAEVAITMDNRDGGLPVEFAEVTVARAIYATGENEYTINGESCRALDVAELLSDAGLGRESHTVVGQGNLDQILNSRAEDRRTLIDEAAGILKHRKRKERALRKLSQVDEHTERVTDLLRELRRQLRPLERQAEAARKHAELTEQLHRVRTIKAVRELDALDGQLRSDDAGAATARDRTAAAQEEAAAAAGEVEALERQLAELTPQVDQAARTHFHLANLAERLQGTADRIAERRRGLVEASEEPVAGRDPARLRAEAAAEREGREALATKAQQAAEQRAQAADARAQAEQSRRAHEQAAAAESRRRSAAREQRLRWEGEITALRQAVAQVTGELGRLESQLSGWHTRLEELDADHESVSAEIQRLDAHTDDLAEQLRVAEGRVAKRKTAADEAAKAEREFERRRAGLEARADALRAAARAGEEGADAVRRAAEEGRLEGVHGALADQLRIADGMAPAVAAALGDLGEALVVDSPATAAGALREVRSNAAGRVRVLPADQPADDGDADTRAEAAEACPPGSRPLVEAVDAPDRVRAAVARALEGVYAVDDLDTAATLVADHPEHTFVTVAGEVVGPHGWVGGSTPTNGAVVAAAAAEEADAERQGVEDELLVAHRRVADADRDLAAAREELEAAQAAMQESDAQLTAAAERLGRLDKERSRAREAIEGLQAQREELATEAAERERRLAELEAQGAPEPEEEEEGPDLEAERLDDVLAAAREAEMEARLAERTANGDLEEADRRITALEREADEVERQLAERERRRELRLRAIARCDELAEVAAAALARAHESARAAEAERARLDEERGQRQGAAGVARERQREADEALRQRQAERHEEDLARERTRSALEAVRTRIRDDLEEDPDELLAAARASDEEDAPLAGDSDRERALDEQEEELVRKIGLLGTVNPLALEELEALRERETFLDGQLEDLRKSRADLLAVLEQVDDRIREVFAQAFADVNAHVERLFPRLFNGGEASLVLTDPDDLLATGVDIEAKPPGKNVKRLSLLSGGERSLTALAVLLAIFAARPSPFYVLDEVEAALDDVNLQRFLDVIDEFRGTSQMIIVTHQKRTMEAADTLYGVSMGAGGVSKVIGQRMEEIQASAG